MWLSCYLFCVFCCVFFFTQDITIRRLEDVIAELEERADAKLEEEAEARSKRLQEVSAG